MSVLENEWFGVLLKLSGSGIFSKLWVSGM